MSQPEPQNPRPPAASSAQDETPAAAAAAAQAEMAQAFQDLAKPDRGEQQAAAMEANLTKLEDKLDALLAQFEATEEAAGIEAPRSKHSTTKPKDAKGNR